jgi:hypothetical protein
MKVGDPVEGMLPEDATPTVRIHDARAQQRESSYSDAAFFDEKGFVLLGHESAVEDWGVDPSTPEAAEERQSCEHRVSVYLLRD